MALHRFPSSHARVFLGWHLNGVGPLPPSAATTTTARRQGPPVGRHARGTWTATLDYVQKTLHLGALLLATQDGRSEYARDERSGLLVLLSARCAATQQRSDPSLINQICSLRAKPACCDFATLALRISQHRSARSKRTPVPPLHHLWCLRPARNYFPGHPHGKRTPAKRGEASWSCPLPVAQQPAAEPTQASTNRHSHASLQSTCQPRALHMTRIASRPARACLGTAQHLFFRCFRPARTWAAGQAYWNEDGIISSHVLSTAVLPQHSILHLHTAVAHSSGTAPVGSFY